MVSLEGVKLFVAASAAMAGLAAFYWFEGEPLLYRYLGVVGGLAVGAAAGLWSERGSAFMKLLGEARGEIRRVIWPTRPETAQTTLAVFVVVVVIGAVIAVFDLGLGTVFGWVLG